MPITRWYIFRSLQHRRLVSEDDCGSYGETWLDSQLAEMSEATQEGAEKRLRQVLALVGPGAVAVLAAPDNRWLRVIEIITAADLPTPLELLATVAADHNKGQEQ